MVNTPANQKQLIELREQLAATGVPEDALAVLDGAADVGDAL